MASDFTDVFDNPVRLFPLSGVVLLPHGTLPLHIFEPRYIQMTEDALASDQRITMVLPKAEAVEGDDQDGPPRIQSVGCVGRIVNEQRLPDGRWTFLLTGEVRVGLREVPSNKLYRQAEAIPLQDVQTTAGNLLRELHRSDILSGLQQLLPAPKDLMLQFLQYLQGQKEDGAFADIVAHAVPVPIATKQQLLATRDVDARLTILDNAIRLLAPRPIGAGNRTFPPRMSEN